MRIPAYVLVLGIVTIGSTGVALGHRLAARPAPDPAPSPTSARGDPADWRRLIEESATREIAAGWLELRSEEIGRDALERGIATYATQFAALPRAIGRHLAEQQTATDRARQDGAVFAALRRADAAGTGPDLAIVASRSRFAAWFAPLAAGEERDGAAHAAAPDLAVRDGDTLVFGSGVFRLRDLMRERSPFPRDVTIRGAGIDATLLVHDGDLGSADVVRNLAFEDCTLCGAGDTFVMPTAPISLRLTRVRIVGFDDGATVVSAQSLALMCEECRFEGGYGRRSAPCSVITTPNSSCAARFSSCLFSGVEPGVVGARAALVFEACRFDAIADDPRERLPDARFVRCEFGPDAAARLPRRELSVRFPEFDPLVHR